MFGSILLICNSVLITTSERTQFWGHYFLTLGYRRYSRWYKWSESRLKCMFLSFGSGFRQTVLHIFHLPKYYSVLQQPWDLERISVLHCLVLNTPVLNVIMPSVVVWDFKYLSSLRSSSQLELEKNACGGCSRHVSMSEGWRICCHIFVQPEQGCVQIHD